MEKLAIVCAENLQKETGTTSKFLPVNLGISVLKSRIFLPGMIQYLFPINLFT